MTTKTLFMDKQWVAASCLGAAAIKHYRIKILYRKSLNPLQIIITQIGPPIRF